MFKRPFYQKVMKRIEGSRTFMQVLAGPRQVGKSTLALQVKKSLSFPSHYATADGSFLHDAAWIEQQWKIGRQLAQQPNNTLGALLILDEIQKIPYWSDTVKRLWDEDSSYNLNLKIMLLGSATLLIQTGLGESLAGRFEVIPIPHWSFQECREAFNFTLEQYIFFGGYPGAALLIEDEERWSQYIIDSIIETSISRDVMLMTRIHKPALLRCVFELGCHFTGHVLSYQRMLGQLQDAGNASTLAHYLKLLSEAGLVAGLQKFSIDRLVQKASSPKLQVFNTALTTAQSHLSFESIQQDREIWKNLVKCTIGAHLINSALGNKIEIFYWKEGSKEVDFVIRKGEKILTLMIKSTEKGVSFRGVEAFCQIYHPQQNLLVGGEGVPIDTFLLTPLEFWIDSTAEDIRKRA
ncbi:MAG: AAA family ATPase [Alphaproteobacteria bacterium]|nr:AAA family ATPase [Alphaproteobacteria bacterium]